MNSKNAKAVIFSDLDGTLLDEKYGYDEVEPIIRRLLSHNASVVLASSKTRWEIDFYRQKLGIQDPFIVENGSAILIAPKYFQTSYNYTRQTQNYNVIELGLPYSVVRKKLVEVKQRTGAEIIGFGDMSVREVAEDASLPFRLASFAKRREYDEPFKIVEGDEKRVLDAIVNDGLCYTRGGRYFHAVGNTDKGKAVAILKNLYQQEYGSIVTIGVGDSDNDFPMLEKVDKPFWLRDTADKKAKCCVWREILQILR